MPGIPFCYELTARNILIIEGFSMCSEYLSGNLPHVDRNIKEYGV